MKKKILRVCACVLAIALPLAGEAQTQQGTAESLSGALDDVFNQMIPMAGQLIGVAQAVAGFGALWYIAFRIWKHLARAEPIDFYPLLRPFAIGIAIMFFIQLVGLMNGILQPFTKATAAMTGNSQKAIMTHIQMEENDVQQTPPVGAYPYNSGNMDQYEQPDGTSDNNGFFSGLTSAFSWMNIKNVFKGWMSWIISLIYEAASLCINTIRIFYLIILIILGPIVLGLSVFDGFHQTLTHWFSRYINIYMWLPVSNIFGAITSKILENMFNLDQNFITSTAYIIFMIISIVGYTTVPNVANYIVQAGGKDTLLHKVNEMSKQAVKAAGAVAMI